MLLRFLLRRWLRKRRQEQHERILALERWIKIFDEWADDQRSNADEAAEMAKQGLTFADAILRRYYLPIVREQLNQQAIIKGITG